MWKYIVVLLFPLIPTIILFIFFQNIAEINYVEHSLAVKVTGAAAFYVIVLLVSIKNMHRFVDPLHRIRKDVVGKWRYETIGYDKNRGGGSAKITMDDNSLGISGTLTLAGHDTQSERKFAWDATEIYLSNDKITWFFNFPGMQREGVARLNFHRDEKGIIQKMLGEWGVAGQERGGSIEMTRV